jgi:hypothetical protein
MCSKLERRSSKPKLPEDKDGNPGGCMVKGARRGATIPSFFVLKGTPGATDLENNQMFWSEKMSSDQCTFFVASKGSGGKESI